MMPTGIFKSTFEKKYPNVKSVLSLINQDHDLNEESKALNYLKRFVRESDGKMLSSFLRFCTGADIITCDKIKLSFTETKGLQRTFTSHTCTDLFGIPVT